MLWLNIILFLVGLVCLIKGGDWFVDGASGLARRFHMPELLIGATVVSIGTTLPEVMVSTGAAFSGHGEIAYGNAVGSIICNASLIAAVSLAFRPSKMDKKPLLLPIAFFFGTAALYLLSAYCFGGFPRPVGIILLLIFAAYMILSLTGNRKNAETLSEDDAEKKTAPKTIRKDILPLILGAALIAVGADLLVDHGTAIAQAIGVPESVIALTFVALGTSLPELVTAITSLVKGHGSLSLGNVIGANLFNMVLVSGISVTVSPFQIPSSQMLFGYPSSLVLDLPLMIAVMGILTVPTLIRGRTSRVQGIILLVIYFAFCIGQFFL